MEHSQPGAAAETPEPPTSAPSLRYPAQLVSEALEDALKEMQDDAEPKEELILSAAWAPQNACAPSPIFPIEVCGGAPADEDKEGRDPSECGEAPEVEEGIGEAVVQGLGVESSTLRDEATSLLGPYPCGMDASLSTVVNQEEMGAWEEEVDAVMSPREPEVVAQEGDMGGLGQAGTSWEEPERGEDEVETLSVEEVDEEGRGPLSPCREDGDAQGLREGKSLQEEAEAAGVVPEESHMDSPMDRDGEEDFVGGEQEKSEHQKMLVCETDPAVEEEREQELCLGQEPSSIPEAIPAEEPSSRAEEDAVGGEAPGTAWDGDGEKGEELAAEDPQAGEAVGPETLGWESRAPEEPGDLQENDSMEEAPEQEELELEPGEEPWSREGDASSQKPHPEEWEVATGDTEGALGTEQPGWVDDTPTSAGGLENEERDGATPAEMEETREGDGDTGSDGKAQQQPPMKMEETQEDDEDAGSDGMAQQQPPVKMEETQKDDGDTGSDGLAQQQPPAETEETREDDGDTGSDEKAQQQPQVEMEETWEDDGGAGSDGITEHQPPVEMEETLEDDGDARSQEQDQQQPPVPAPGHEEDSTTGQPWEARDEDDEDEQDPELGQPETIGAVEEDAGGPGEPEQAAGMSVELEDTLPDHTPLHLYQGEKLAAVAPHQNPLVSEETTDTAPTSQIAPEDEGEDEPPNPTATESREEEEEGYFIISAPNQEVSSSEEAEIAEDFEEIKVEATEAGKDKVEAPGEASLVPEDEGHVEGFDGDEDTEMPTEEPEMPKDEGDAGGVAAGLEEGSAAPEAEPGPPGA
ncbi:PREDICTED: retinitis pigmentosa 1-like 1 protein, partial [Mesitornis unicolor]|uniref:retinitis pigmentosa 1-like 1 protein n=1 Tax=Mesitornis unicolor TaxID=54374 RepID=UPI000529107F